MEGKKMRKQRISNIPENAAGTGDQAYLSNCSFTKLILMLFVVLCHSVAFFGGDWFTVYKPSGVIPFMKKLADWTGSFHVYGFTIVSGYLFCYLKNTLGKYTDYKAFILNKTKRLIVPYVFVSAVWVAPISAYYFKYNAKDILVNYILGCNPAQLWFLLVLFWAFVIGWILTKHLASDAKCVVMSLVLYIIGYVGRSFLPDLFSLFRGLQFVIFFVTGYIIKKHDAQYSKPQVVSICVILHILLWNLIPYLHDMNIVFKAGYDLVFHLVSAIGAFELLQYLGTKVKWQNDRAVQKWIKLTMPIYLFHQQIIYMVISILNNKTSPAIIMIMSFLVSIVGSATIGFFLIMNKRTRFLIGEK